MTKFKKYIAHPIKRRIAKYYLILLQKLFGLKVIGITGSAGKTTTKEMVASILKLRAKVAYSVANIDPIYNIPTTILKCSPLTKYLVLEMGVEYPGEMDFYLWLAKPDVGVIINIYPTHTLYFKSIDGVFMEKSKLIKNLKVGDTAILNTEDRYLKNLSKLTRASIVWFGEDTDIMSMEEKITDDFHTGFNLILNKNYDDKTYVQLDITGKQFVQNALAASAVAKVFGFTIKEIKRGLENFHSQDHRMKIIKHKSGAIIVDDSYNNNPEAAKATLNTFNNLSSNREKVIVFGDMLELGNLEPEYHKDIGSFIGQLKVDRLICVGKAAEITAKSASKFINGDHIFVVSHWRDAIPILESDLNDKVMVLVKGSRSIGLDNLVNQVSGL
jgi:UDP-N-acetylmuramoyl-tripeptide--D-alanyl-D-alanine ligase